MIKKLSVFSLFCVVVVLNACSGDEISKEDEVRQVIDSGVLAAENRSYSDLAVLIDNGYADDRGHDKKKFISMLRAYFYMHKNVHLFVKYDEIIFEEENKVFVSMYVAMAGNVIADINALASLRAKVYKFELQLTKQDEWLLNQAKWQVSSFKDMIKVKHAQMGDQ